MLFRSKELSEEMLGLCEEASHLGSDYSKLGDALISEANMMVSEIYSPPRVTAAAKLLPSLGWVPGFAMDLTTVDENDRAWDFDDPEQRRRAKERVESERPMLLIGSPMCTDWSSMGFKWHHMKPEEKTRRMTEARRHLRFCMKSSR